MKLPDSIGKYRVEKRLGEGGMGTVYLAHDEGIDRHVAIKVLRADDEEMRRRFRAEARSVGRLKHSNIVTVHDYSEFEGSPCIVMEYVEGETLASLIRRNAAIPVARKLHLMEQVCRGLAYAHRAGIVHRDIKPSNLMVDPEGTIKIVDFGIARSGERGVTLTGKVIGTLAYMAPEQARGESVDRRSDIFAVGLVLYEFLSGRGAFPGDSDFSIVNRIVTGDPEPFRHPDSALSNLIVPVIDRALDKTPDLRYQDADQMATALAAVRASLESHSKAETPQRPKSTEVLSGLAPAVPLNVRELDTKEASSPTVMQADAEDDTLKLSVAPHVAVEPKADAEAKRPILSPKPEAPRVARSSRSQGWKWMVVGSALAALVLVVMYQTAVNQVPVTSAPVESPASQSVPAVNTGSAPAASVPDPAPVPPPSVQAPPKGSPNRPEPSPLPAHGKLDKPESDVASDVTARLAAASRLFQEGDYAASVAVYGRILAGDRRNEAAINGLAAVKRAQISEERFVQVAQYLAEGRRRHEEAEYDAAIAAYQAALKIDPTNASAIRGLAETRKAQAAEAAALKRKPGLVSRHR